MIPIEGVYADDEITIWLILNQLNFLITTILLIYIVFEDDIKRLTIENARLNTQIEKSKIFVNLGENIAGLIHNMNSDIGIISLSLSMFEQEIDNPSIKYIRTGNERLQSKIKNILTLAKYSQNEDDTDFSLNALLHSLLEVFHINKTYGIIKLNKYFKDELYFYGNTSEISQVFENIIKNSYEALVEKSTIGSERDNPFYTPVFDVTLHRNEGWNILTFIDNGPGIRACLDAGCKGNCKSCNVFQVGRTTKSLGTGLGMISVFRTLKKYKGEIVINTSEKGTEIEVSLPVNNEPL
ncbi:MAG: HAMP domain-containing sensor histidine kinase [Spirochaetaceae bacterium]|nr:HAMP domain-containing sensor histidine kinase [Spirochaetaceae bacterium]